MKSKGQALVEFIILLPVIMMIIFIIIDFSNIFYQKNHLEGITNDVVEYKENGKDNNYITKKINDNSIKIKYSKKEDSLKVNVTKKVKLITPFSNLFFDNPYIIKTERTFIYE